MRRDRYFILFGKGIEDRSWRGLNVFIFVYVSAFIVGGLLAPWAFEAVQRLAVNASADSVWTYLAGKGLEDYFDRLRMLCALFSVLWLICYCKLWGRFGFNWINSGVKSLFRWFILGIASMGVAIIAQSMVLEVTLHEIDSISSAAKLFFTSFLAALLISWAEESIFRGMVFRMFYSAMNPVLAIVASALIFAVAHFKSVNWPEDASVQWFSGLEIAWQSFLSAFLTFEIGPFFNYFLIGIVLNLVFLRSRSLIPCMGLHAGWVFIRTIWTQSVDVVNEGKMSWFLGDEGIVNGSFPIVILLVLSVWFYAETIRKQESNFYNLEKMP